MTPIRDCEDAISEATYTTPIAVTSATGTSTSGAIRRSSGETDVSEIPPSRLVESARAVLRETDNHEAAQEAHELLSTAQEALELLQAAGFELRNLPPLHAFSLSDGSILIEWISGDFRIGLSLESDSSESSWYLVSSGDLGDIGVSGNLSGVTRQELVLWLAEFAMWNS